MQVSETGNDRSAAPLPPAVPNVAGANLACDPFLIFGVTGRQIVSIDTRSWGTLPVAATITTPNRDPNALGLRSRGSEALYLSNGGYSAGGSPTIYSYSSRTGTTSQTAGTPLIRPLSNVVRGGLNPATGIFYYGGQQSGGEASSDYYAYDAVNHTPIGYVGTFDSPEGGGDLAFDSDGDLLIAAASTGSNSRLYRISDVPTVAQTSLHMLRSESSFTLPATGIVGITVAGDGNLYASTEANVVYTLDPDSGRVRGPSRTVRFPDGGALEDLASCINPGSVQLKKTLPRGRFSANDQFTMTITSSGLLDGSNTATTSGSASGIQTAVAGPVDGFPGDVYTLTESAASGNLANYSSTISCQDASGRAVPVTPGRTRGSYTLTFPRPATARDAVADITCVLSNQALRPAISLTKTADRDTTSSTSDITTYTYTATNTGNTPLASVRIDDPQNGLSELTCTPSQPATLAAGAQLRCSATRATTQADLDGGNGIVNTGTVTARTPAGDRLTTTASASVTPVQAPAISLVKNAAPTSVGKAGDTVTYTFAATNTGNVALAAVSITDPHSGLSALDCTTDQPTTLAPGDTLNCTATYTATQADLDAGRIANTASVTGTPPADAPLVTDTSTAAVTAPPQPALEVVKTSDANTAHQAGDVVEYTIVTTNTGNVTLTNVLVTDPLPGLSTPICDQTAPYELAPGDALTCAASYPVSQADVDAGLVRNTVTVNGTPPGDTPPPTGTDTQVTLIEPSPAISLVKDADPTVLTAAGQLVRYTFTGTNTGNVSLADVRISDPHTGLSPLTCDPAPGATIAPKTAIVCTATYTATQADVDAGQILNTATITGTPPTGPTVTDAANAKVVIGAAPALSLVKSSNADNGTVGDTITYTFLATNTGNVALSKVMITDPLPGLSDLTCDRDAPVTLQPNQTITCTATYVLTQADIDRHQLVNTATVVGEPPNDQPLVRDHDTHTVHPQQHPGLQFAKTADVASISVGGTVHYTLTATNTGNVTLADVTVSDPLPGLAALTCRPGAPATLTPGQILTCTASYIATASDGARGQINNIATVTAVPLGGDPQRPVTTQDKARVKVIVAGPPELPNTGGPAISWLALGLLLAASGAWLSTRRRHR